MGDFCVFFGFFLGGWGFLYFFRLFFVVVVVVVFPVCLIIVYFSFQPVLHDWCNKGRGMCYPVCGMMNPCC